MNYFMIYGALSLAHIAVQVVLGHAEHVLNRRDSQDARCAPLASQLVTVVVPVYNEDPLLLARCLASIAEQDHRPIEVIVIDDGSTNRGEHDAVYRQYRKLPGWTVLVEVVNRGKRRAQKVAFDRARG